MLEAEQQFRKIIGCTHLAALAIAVEKISPPPAVAAVGEHDIGRLIDPDRGELVAGSADHRLE